MHTHYKGTGKVHSFRGLLADGEQTVIDIEGSVGAIVWRITKFELMSNTPGLGDDHEAVIKIYREEQTTLNATVDFSQGELLAVGYWQDTVSAATGGILNVIFDNAIFVRNVWVSLVDVGGNNACNYYIELEEVTISAAGKAQLVLAAARRTLN